ncbi:MAG: hypothetical protein NUV75_01395 [Gallionella sp.]|nr:hypothetical protein [Gallionella sp.]
MEEQKPYDRFLEFVQAFTFSADPSRHFGHMVLGQNGHRGVAPIGSFALADPNGISLVRLVIENEGNLCGMMTSLELNNGALTLIIYEPERTTEIIPLERLKHFSLEPNLNKAFAIENERLVKQNGQLTPSSPEPQDAPIDTPTDAVSDSAAA